MIRSGTLVFSLFIAASALAATPERVLIVDDVRLTPTLEKGTARQKMLDAVTATVGQHGWQPVVSATCHDFACVGPATAAAPANYALILTASLSSGGDAMYATDLAVSLWHDGAVVARWTEEDEKTEAANTATGASFIPCGPPNGLCVAPLLTSKMQQYSTRLLEAESGAIEKRAAAVAATTAAVKPAVAAPPAILETKPPVPASPGIGVAGIVGWSVGAVGAAALATGISLWALDGHASSNCASAGSDHLCDVYDTRTPGIILTAVGAAGLVAGGLLVWRAELDRGTQVAAGPGGLVLRGRF